MKPYFLHMKWQTEGKPPTGKWCILNVRETRRLQFFLGPVVGSWDGTRWMIRSYDPAAEDTCLVDRWAGGSLEVLAWCLIQSPPTEK